MSSDDMILLKEKMDALLELFREIYAMSKDNKELNEFNKLLEKVGFKIVSAHTIIQLY